MSPSFKPRGGVSIPVSAGPLPPTVVPTGAAYPDGWRHGICRGCGAGQLVTEDGDCVDCAPDSRSS